MAVVLAVQLRVAVWPEANPPVPVSDATGGAGVQVAFVLKVTVPEDGPAPGGVNDIVIGWLKPTGIVIGRAGSATLNPAPVTVALDRVSDVLPVLDSVTLCSDVNPRIAVPNDTSVGATVKQVIGVMPLPLATSETTGEEAALLVNVTPPAIEPIDCGAKEIVTT